MKTEYVLAFILLCCGLQACTQSTEVRHYTIEKSVFLQEVTPPTPTNETGYMWTLPQGWSVTPSTSEMVKASFSVKDAPLIKITLSEFGGQGGGIVANVNRWLEQLNLPAMNEEGINKIKRSAKGKLGNYSWFLLAHPQDNSKAVLASILSTQNSTLFIKMTGPLHALEAQKESFLNFSSSLQNKTKGAL